MTTRSDLLITHHMLINYLIELVSKLKNNITKYYQVVDLRECKR